MRPLSTGYQWFIVIGAQDANGILCANYTVLQGYCGSMEMFLIQKIQEK
jgi:hypothetical protein